ncbi:MAG: TlpA family protein disulfide reductase [Ruminococcaceae bacterium]|nr:TlpA family protein disulfide reductase [Oscillospiraceae bacterium]
MKKHLKLILSICIVVVVFVMVYVLYNSLSKEYTPDNMAQTSTQAQTSQENETQDFSAPDFTVLDEDNNEVKLSSFFGKPIVLNMWASWCPPCKSEMPHFEQAFKENKDVQFLMVNMTAGDNIDDAKSFIKSEGYTFPVFYDTTGEAATVYGASSLPMTIFIDKNGDLVTYAVGALSKEQLDEGISMLK